MPNSDIRAVASYTSAGASPSVFQAICRDAEALRALYVSVLHSFDRGKVHHNFLTQSKTNGQVLILEFLKLRNG